MRTFFFSNVMRDGGLVVLTAFAILIHEIIGNEIVLVVMLGATGLLYGLISPARRVLFVLGVLLPISSVLETSPYAWDAMRLALVAAIIERQPLILQKFKAPIVSAIALGAFIVVTSTVRNDFVHIPLGASFLLSAITAIAILGGNSRYALGGFVVGATASGLAVWLEYFTGIVLGSGNEGWIGFTGLGGTSTFTGPVLALALYFHLNIWIRQGQNVAFLIVPTFLLSSILLTGSRAGFVMACLAMISAAFARETNWKIRSLLFGSMTLVFLWSLTTGGVTTTKLLDRGFESTERALGWVSAWEHFVASPIVGISQKISGVTDQPGADQIHSTYGYLAAYFGGVGLAFGLGFLTYLLLSRMPIGLFIMVASLSLVEIQGYLGGATLPLLLALATRGPALFEPGKHSREDIALAPSRRPNP